MKIAFVYDAVYPYVKGGAEKRIYELSLWMAEKGHEVHIFGMKYWDGPNVVKKDGIIYHGVCRKKDLYVKGRRSIFEAFYFACFLFVPLLREKVSVIDCQAFPYFSVFSSFFVSKINRCRLVVTWHEFWGEYWYRYLGLFGVFGKFIERMTAFLGDGRVAVSHLTAEGLEKSGIKGVHVIPNGINVDKIKNTPPSYEYSSDLIFAGRLIAEKNVDLLLRSLVFVREKFPCVKALIVGDGPEKLNLEKLSQELGLFGTVSFSGFFTDERGVISAMKASKVFVLPSVREGFGITVCEAMACGLFVVTVNHPSNAARELVCEGVNGYVAELSPGSLGDAVIKALCSKKEPEVKGETFSYACDYGWEKISERLICVYEGKSSEK